MGRISKILVGVCVSDRAPNIQFRAGPRACKMQHLYKTPCFIVLVGSKVNNKFPDGLLHVPESFAKRSPPEVAPL